MNGYMNDRLRNEIEICVIGIAMFVVVYMSVLMYVGWF
jgi:hypothetical protein